GAEGFEFSLSRATLDLSDLKNPVSFTLDPQYFREYFTLPDPDLWRGLYVDRFTLTLPEQFKNKQSGKRIILEASRPKLTGKNHVFLINEREIRHVSRQINHICEKILLEAGIINRERTGVHLFRHRFGVMLLNKGVPAPVITAALGHSSPSTLDAYLDSDLIHLKECGLSIEKFPISPGNKKDSQWSIYPPCLYRWGTLSFF
ncbi:MAG: tyrosine-type recombinase/integrase, partial [Prevotella sp.]|nr:tyrosine-type recombinase/integrase [Prevotella sp.]